MTIKSPKEIYEKVAYEVYPRLKDRDEGILHEAIRLILEDQPEFQQNIQNQLGIQNTASIKEDYEIISDLISVVLENNMLRFVPGIETIAKFGNSARQSLPPIFNFFPIKSDGEDEKMKWILVVGASILIGLPLCIQYLKSQKKNQFRKSKQSTLNSSNSIPVALCLVIPASVASKFKGVPFLKADELSDLIDSASYFLCHPCEEIDLKEGELDISADEYISPESSQEVYVRIHIEDGRNLIEKNIPYALKTNLQPGVRYEVEKMFCLRSLSGLEAFNLV